MLDRFSRRGPAEREVPADAPRILVVDDDEEEGVLIADALARVPGQGYHVDQVPSVEAGLERLASGRYAVGLIDHRLGHRSGLDLLRDAGERGLTTPLVMLTGERDPELDLAASELGAVDFLQKGRTDPVDLERTLRYAIARGEAFDVVRRTQLRMEALERLGRLLGGERPSAELFSDVVGLLAEGLERTYLSLYLADADGFALAAQHGYEAVVPRLERSTALEGVVRSGRPALLPNHSVDADVRGRGEPRMELCVPLTHGYAEQGLLLVGSPDERPIDAAEHAVIAAGADRIAAALAVARDHAEVTARAERFRRLTRFVSGMNAATSDELHERIASGARELLAAEHVVLYVRGADGGFEPGVATDAGAGAAVGAATPLGQLQRRALTEGSPVVEELDGRQVAAVPLRRSGETIAMLRIERTQPLGPLERELLPLIGDQAALALATQQRLEAAELSALRDPVTSLYREAFLWAALGQFLAQRGGVAPERRLPLSALVMAPVADRERAEAEDEALRRLAGIAAEVLHARDIVARRGRSIVAVLPHLDADAAGELAERILVTYRETDGDAAGAPRLAIGSGAVSETGDEPLAAADAAHAMAVRLGGDTVVRG